MRSVRQADMLACDEVVRQIYAAHLKKANYIAMTHTEHQSHDLGKGLDPNPHCTE